MELKERLTTICDELIEFFEWDLNADEERWQREGSRLIKRSEGLMNAVYKAKSEANLNHGRGITMLYDRISGGDGYSTTFCSYFGMSNPDDFKIEEWEEQTKLFHIIRSIKVLYKDWHNEFELLISNKFETKTDIDPSILETINGLIVDNKFSLSIYQDAGDKILPTDNFVMCSKICISNNIVGWVENVKNQKEFLEKKSKDTIYVTLFGRLDRVDEIYSNWIFTLHKGNTIWFLSDEIHFDNPHQKRARLDRRGLYDDRLDLYDKCEMPYEVFFDLDKIRKKNKGVANDTRIKLGLKDKLSFFDPARVTYDKATGMVKKQLDKRGIGYSIIYCDYSYSGGDVNYVIAKRDGYNIAIWSRDSDDLVIYNNKEVLYLDFDDIGESSKVFTTLVINEIIQYMGNKNVEAPKVMLAHEFIEMKMLEGEEISPDNNSGMRDVSDESKDIYTNLIKTVGMEETALVPKSYGLVKKSEGYDAGWIGTTESLQSLSEWLVLDSQATPVDNKLSRLGDKSREANNWLTDNLNNRFDSIIERVFQARKINSKFNHITPSGSFSSLPKNHRVHEMVNENDFTNKSVYTKRGSGVGKRNFSEEFCRICEEYNARVVKHITIHTYADLMWLLDVKREDIHKYFQNYRKYNYIPYVGNSLLDQTHPFTSLQDPASRSNPNGIYISVYMCKRCFNKKRNDIELLEIEVN